jgi:ribosomal protein L19
MATKKGIEQSIALMEGFEVRIRSEAVRRNLPDYSYGRAARAAFTVADWKRARFERTYEGLDVDVLRADGKVASSSMTLAKIRSGYE